MYELTFSKPVDGVASITFPRMTWARYKQMMSKIQVDKTEDDFNAVKSLVLAFVGVAEPKLSDEQLSKLSLADVRSIESLYSHLETRGGNWDGGQFKLETPIPVAAKDGEANITGFTFKAQTLDGAWDYLAEGDTYRQYELFIKAYGRHVGDNSQVKELPFNPMWIDLMDAKDVLFIGRHIAGKSTGGSPTWKKLSD